MTIESDDIKSLVKYRIGQAEEAVQDVELLIENERWRSAINRIYFGMFYSLLALGLSNGFGSSKHSQLIGWFNKSFVHTGIVDSKYGKTLNRAFNRRTKGDYDSFVEFEKEVVLEMFKEMKDFISTIKGVIDLK